MTAKSLRKVWMKQELPVVIEGRTVFKDGYEDMLDSRRSSSDLVFCLKSRNEVRPENNAMPPSVSQVKEAVLRSQRVLHAITETARHCNKPIQDVRREARSILEEMAHNLNMFSVRHFALGLVKIIKALYQRVYVNTDGVDQLRSLLTEYPVLFVPSHRSYADFILISYMCFHYDIPLPYIAAAMDFKSMHFFGWLLRNCGAFYIRRNFGEDSLYWAIFTEYVQLQLVNKDAPIEFFLEGTRSRTQKSYIPKTGMLSVTLEPFLKAQVPDIMIVPISISYDRILEENLYAYELIGVPKPKESTSGLFAARAILNEDFGCVHIHIGKPTSIRQYSEGRICRANHGLYPRFIPSPVSPVEQTLMQNLAVKVVRQQQENMVLSPFQFIAAILMNSRDGILMTEMCRELDWLIRFSANLGAYVDWPSGLSTEDVIRQCVSQHSNLVCIDENTIMVQASKPSVQRKRITVQLSPETIHIAASLLSLALYRNMLLHVFVRPALVALSVTSHQEDTISLETVKEMYSFLKEILSREFIFENKEDNTDFNLAVLNLSHCGALTMRDDSVFVQPFTNRYTLFLCKLLEPFLVGYWILCQYLMSLRIDVTKRPLARTPREIAHNSQGLAHQLIQEGLIRHYEVLSLDLLTNALWMMVDLGVMTKEKREGSRYFCPDKVAVARIADRLSDFLHVLPSTEKVQLLVRTGTLVLQSSKL